MKKDEIIKSIEKIEELSKKIITNKRRNKRRGIRKIFL